MVLGGQPPGRVGRRRNISEITSPYRAASNEAAGKGSFRVLTRDLYDRRLPWHLLNVLVARLDPPRVGHPDLGAGLLPPAEVRSGRTNAVTTTRRSARISDEKVRRRSASPIRAVTVLPGVHERRSAVVMMESASRISGVTVLLEVSGSPISVVTVLPGVIGGRMAVVMMAVSASRISAVRVLAAVSGNRTRVATMVIVGRRAAMTSFVDRVVMRRQDRLSVPLRRAGGTSRVEVLGR